MAPDLNLCSRTRRQPRTVVAIKGQMSPDVIPQKDLEKIRDLQAVVWKCNHEVHLVEERLRSRLLQGAILEYGPLDFDRDLKMVRRRH